MLGEGEQQDLGTRLGAQVMCVSTPPSLRLFYHLSKFGQEKF